MKLLLKVLTLVLTLLLNIMPLNCMKVEMPQHPASAGQIFGLMAAWYDQGDCPIPIEMLLHVAGNTMEIEAQTLAHALDCSAQKNSAIPFIHLHKIKRTHKLYFYWQ